IALNNRRVAEVTHPVDIENFLDQERTGQNDADHVPQAGGDGNQRVAERVHEDHAFFIQAFRKCSPNVILAKILHQGILHQDRQRGEVTDHVAKHGQKHVIELLDDLLKETEVFPIVWAKASQRKHIPEAAAAEQYEQRGSHRPTRHGVSEKNDHAADEIKLASVPYGLPHAKRHAHQITQQEASHAKED